jgi:carboxyl-terminal processing protease
MASFSEPTAEQFDTALAKIEKTPIRGLIIDLRGNPGGLLDSAVDLISRFVGPGKVVVRMKARGERTSEARTFGGVERNFKYPIVMLMDEDSASAAEIFAGAMRDYQMATLIGEHSYGKASVQTLFPLRDDAFAKITIARYYLPSTKDISRKVDEDGVYVSGGLAPDIKVDVPVDQAIEVGKPEKDPVLKRALEFFTK